MSDRQCDFATQSDCPRTSNATSQVGSKVMPYQDSIRPEALTDTHFPPQNESSEMKFEILIPIVLFSAFYTTLTIFFSAKKFSQNVRVSNENDRALNWIHQSLKKTKPNCLFISCSRVSIASSRKNVTLKIERITTTHFKFHRVLLHYNCYVSLLLTPKA